MLKRVRLVVVVLSIPVAAGTLYKPMRVLAPEWVAGITCMGDAICIDDLSRYPQAERLYEDALTFMGSSVDRIENAPRAIFCASDGCFRSFGFVKSPALAVGTIE
jgi:hypothetical protein